MKIGIVGMGWVGSSIAAAVLQRGVATELLVHDIRADLAEGEAMDLAHGASFYPTAQVRAVGLEAMVEADAVVIAAGRGGGPTQSRLDLAADNAKIVAEIAAALRDLGGLLIVVTNPVDVMTRVAVAASGLDPARVIGTGTMLDTARLRHVIGRDLDLAPRSIHAQVVGEHGDSEVVLWSSATIGGIPLRGWPSWRAAREPALAAEVRDAAFEIIRRKGATNHAIGAVTAALLRWALGPARRVLTVSSVLAGATVRPGVALSLASVVGREGIIEVVNPATDPRERDALVRSAELLDRAYAELA
jgi:L-lactate dehydrogenase